jgi:hypothetical protein
MQVTYDSGVSYQTNEPKPTCCGRKSGTAQFACGSCPFN